MTEDPELKKYLEEQRALLERVYVSNERLRKTILWSNLIYLFVIVVPIVAAIFLLPSLLKPIIGSYGDLLKP